MNKKARFIIFLIAFFCILCWILHDNSKKEFFDDKQRDFNIVTESKLSAQNPFGAQTLYDDYVQQPSIKQALHDFYDPQMFLESQEQYKQRAIDRNWSVVPRNGLQNTIEFAKFLYGNDDVTRNCKTDQRECFTVDELPQYQINQSQIEFVKQLVPNETSRQNENYD